jgi:peptidoglycan biosynthesis protein MviN/MurJ (putative lipid II flippase)
LNNIFARAFYAVGDILTPMKISVFCLALNLLLTAIFLFGCQLGPGALGLANTLSAACNLGLLLYALRKKLRTLDMRETVAGLPVLAVVGLAAGLVAWIGRLLWNAHLGHAGLLMRLGEVFAPMTAATLIYFALAWWMNIPSAREMIRLAFAKK